MTSLDFLKALSVLAFLILLTNQELKILTPFSSFLGSSGSGYRYGFTAMVLKLVGPLGSCTLYISPLIPSNLNRPVHLPLYLVLPSHYISISKLKGRS